MRTPFCVNNCASPFLERRNNLLGSAMQALMAYGTYYAVTLGVLTRISEAFNTPSFFAHFRVKTIRHHSDYHIFPEDEAGLEPNS